MKEEPLHPWIEPELEARITALVLGEASDFEREELEHLIKERAELALFRKRTESLHGLLQEIATGESSDDNDDWKLSDEKRSSLLAVIDGKAQEEMEESVVTETVVKPKVRRGSFLRTFTQIAALLFVMALIAGLMMPSNKGVIDYALTRKLKTDTAFKNEIAAGDAFAATSSPNSNGLVASVAKASTPNYKASSRSALLAIQGNLEQYSQTPEDVAQGVAMIENKLKHIIIPHVEFQDTPLKDALAFLLEKSVELDVAEPTPSKKGINFVLPAGSTGYRAPVGGGFDDAKSGEGVGDIGITLKLSNVPLVTALKYTVSLAQLKYKVEPHAVVVVPLSTPDSDLYTNVYNVPPSFMTAASGGGGVGDHAADPFADPADKGAGPARRRSAKDILQEAGITFAPGSSVIYNPTTSQLIVRNTQDQMELVEAYKDSMKGRAEEGLSFPDMNDEAQISNSANVGQSFGMWMKTPSSDLDPFASAGGGGAASDPFADAGNNAGSKTEMASADPFAAPSRDGAAKTASSPFEKNLQERSKLKEKPANIALGKSLPLDQITSGARKPQAPRGGFDTRLAQQNNQVAPSAGRLPEIGMVAAEAKADLNAAVVGGMVSSDVVAKEQTRIAGKKAASKSRALTERETVSARGQISARGKMELADSQPKAAGTLRVSRSDGFAKTKGKQDSDAFAANVPAKSTPPPAAAPMTAMQEEIEARLDVSANQKTQDRVSRRKVVGTDSPRAAEEDFAMEMVEKKKVMNKESRENHLRQVKSRAEMKAPKQIALREMTVGNRSRQSLVKGDAIDSLVESEEMSRDAKGNKDAGKGQALAIASDSINGLISQSQPKSLAPKIIPAKKFAPPTGLNEKNAEDEAFSTFSLHVSDVSFKLAQSALAKGEWPDASKIRIEEFVNAFDYGDPMPSQNEKVASQMEQSIHPFLQQRNLLRVSMRTAAAGRSAQTPLRLTFLLDNSGSMERSDRQQTVQRAFALLAEQLQPMDQVTLISFARQPRLLADKVSGSKSDQLVNIVSNIPSEGGTNLEAALKLAFEKAQEQQIDNAQNRIIMLTDGAANLGNANPENLSKMIEGMRDAGIAFDAAGIGADGLNDEILEALTRKGDGRYYLLDQPDDADEGFARQIAGALRPAAKNVKVQIEFNPKRVGNYKLLGFEKHRLKKEDFRNDKVDAAEMAAAEAGVAVYQFEAKPDGEGDVGSVSVRFRDMSTGQMVENRWPIPYEADAPRIDQAAPSLRIASTAALLAAKLKGEPLGGSVDLQTLSNVISALPDRQRNTKRVQELQQMINQARQVSGK